MRLVYIFTTRVLASYEKEFGISYFRNKGWKTEIIDLSPIITPTAYERIKTGIYAGDDLLVLYSKREYKKHIRSINEKVCFLCTDYNRVSTRFLFSCLKGKNMYGFLWLGSPVEPEISEKANSEVHKKLDLKNIYNSIYVRLPHVLQGVSPAGFIAMSIGAGHERLKELACVDKNTIIKYVQGNDFEQYRRVKKNEERLLPEKYCVFIDEFMGYHPDVKDPHLIWTQDKIDQHYREVRNFFSYIELETGLKVVVALHPRADFSNHPECYEGFKTIRFRTAELIKDSEFVITHYSDALSYVILFHKPCISIETTIIKETPWLNRGVKIAQRQFHLFGIDISNEQYKKAQIQDFLKVDYNFQNEFIRKYYYRDYVDENTAVRPLWEQIEELIKMKN